MLFDTPGQLFKNQNIFKRFVEVYKKEPKEYFADSTNEFSGPWSSLTMFSSGLKCIECGKKPSFAMAQKQQFVVNIKCSNCY